MSKLSSILAAMLAASLLVALVGAGGLPAPPHGVTADSAKFACLVALHALVGAALAAEASLLGVFRNLRLRCERDRDRANAKQYRSRAARGYALAAALSFAVVGLELVSWATEQA